MLHGVEPEGAELQQIKKPAWRRHDNVSRTFQSMDLQINFVAATGDFDKDLLLAKLGILEEMLADLFGEFPRRREDEALQRRIGGIDLREQRQPERRRLAGPGLRLGNKVPTILDKKGNCAGLNGCRIGDTQRVETTNQILRNAEL